MPQLFHLIIMNLFEPYSDQTLVLRPDIFYSPINSYKNLIMLYFAGKTEAN